MKKTLMFIQDKKFDFATLEMVLHSLNITANNHKRAGDIEGENRFFHEKEVIMKKLLNPVYLEEIGDRAFVIYDADKHRYRIPIESFGVDEAVELYETLPIVTHESYYRCGKKIKGCLDEEALDKFFTMVLDGDYMFIPS